MRKIGLYAFAIILSLGFICWIIISCEMPESYISAPIHSIITIVLALFVSYYLVQKNTDKRKRYELAERLIEQAKNKVTDVLSLLHNNELTKKNYLLPKRAISNKLDICERITVKENYKVKLNQCKEKIKNFETFIEDGTTKNDLDKYIRDNKQEAIKIFEDIEHYCDEIIVGLWTDL